MSVAKRILEARDLAEERHAGQLDKAGRPYIGHPERVAARMDTEDGQVVGWLHDTVEDTGLSLDEVEARFGGTVARAVDAISRRPGEDWDDYLVRVKANALARQVKISDLIDNSSLARLPRVTLKDVERQAKYNRALRFLMED